MYSILLVFTKSVMGQNKNQIKLLRCKTKILTSKLNARNPIRPSQIQKVIGNTKQHNINIVWLEEHRIFHQDNYINYKAYPSGWTIANFTAWKNTKNTRMGRIGLRISQSAYKALNNIESTNQRTMVASFHGNPLLNVVCVYSATNCSLDQEIESFYSDLRGMLNSISKHNIKIIADDMNSQLGQDNVKWSFHETANRNGLYLKELLLECQLQALNTKVHKRKGKS